MVNPGYTRRQEFACTLEELEQYSSVILYENEILYVKQANGGYDLKIGDGKTPVGELPYVIRYSDIMTVYNALIANAERLEKLDLGLSNVDGQLFITFEEETNNESSN